MAFKKILPVLFLCWLTGLATQAQQIIKLKPNTIVPIRIMTQASSEDYYPVKAIVDQAVTDSAGNEVIAAGTEVVLQITKTPARGSGRPGKVMVEPLRVPTPGGQTVQLSGMATFIGEDRHDTVVLAAVGGCLFFGPLGLLLLVIKGKPAYIPPGYVLSNVVISSIE